MEGWIKLHRKFLEWEWFEDDYMVKLFIYILLKANYEDKKWRGIDVKRGQLITGLNSLSDGLNMSVKVIRNRLDKLEKTGEIGRQTGNQYSVITINNYDSYQIADEDMGKQTGNQRANEGQSKGKRGATTKEVKKDNKDKNKRASEFRDELKPFKDKYGSDILNEFYSYWTESNKAGRMRFEMQKTWETSRRLSTWFKRSDIGKKEPGTVTVLKLDEKNML